MHRGFTRLLFCMVFGASEWLPSCFSAYWQPDCSLKLISSNRQVLMVVVALGFLWKICAMPGTTPKPQMWVIMCSDTLIHSQGLTSINVCILQGNISQRDYHTQIGIQFVESFFCRTSMLHFLYSQVLQTDTYYKGVSLKLGL